MSSVCFDASAALAFVLPDEPLHVQAVALLKALTLQDITLCAPAIFAYECDSVIRLRVWKGTLTEPQAYTARAALEALSIAIEYDPDDRARAFEIASIYAQPRVYDATYAAFAESRGIDLVTTDTPFYEAVKGSKRPKSAPALTFVKLLV